MEKKSLIPTNKNSPKADKQATNKNLVDQSDRARSAANIGTGVSS